MKIKLLIDYRAQWGQKVCVCGSIAELGNWDEGSALDMQCITPSLWAVEFETEDTAFTYRYLIKRELNIERKEEGRIHQLKLESTKNYHIQDCWNNQSAPSFLYTSAFTQSFFSHKETKPKYTKRLLALNVDCPYVEKNQQLVFCSLHRGWDEKKSLLFTHLKDGLWQLLLDVSETETSEYRLAIYDNDKKTIVDREECERHISSVDSQCGDMAYVENVFYRKSTIKWKAAGVAIPVFSLRSQDSFGIGEFSDLKKLIDWATATGQKLIQILPINDTSITHTWRDSYPYNATSTYALHPIYLGLKAYPLKNRTYEKEAKRLNELPDVDYEAVIALKMSYIKDLFAEIGDATLKEKNYLSFYKQNEYWLYPYACFCYLRDKYQTADFSLWKTHCLFDAKELKKLIKETDVRVSLEQTFFMQYLLHKQLTEVKEYAHQHEIVLKGDIPIGISRHSVEAWVEPHLFNLEVQAGAPPDDFSVLGQNWGFPTYNWEEMAKDGYQWWISRFRKMADYFDAYRIDHILGFFRIWEIPMSSVQGLLGYFSPALPLSVADIRSLGLDFDECRMSNPYIHEHFLESLFGDDTAEVKKEYLKCIDSQRYELKGKFNTQQKIEKHFAHRHTEKESKIKEGLFHLCNEVLLIRDRNNPDKYHPRIAGEHTYSFKDLDENAKYIFYNLHNDYYYHRHSQFWREEAMKKLPTLIASTSMLVCGEDLGMVPQSVPSVMRELEILSLEIERMPKEGHLQFNFLELLPYLSVCTTSTHDMAPIRLWWKENRELTQRYYNQVLWRLGLAPDECGVELCQQILLNHLNSPALLTIIPMQDWLSMDENLRRADPKEERINIPADPDHYWRYRMHITLEDLLKAVDFNNQMKIMIESSGRA